MSGNAGIGNGFPLSVVIVRREIAEAMTSRVFMSTMGSNPTTSAAGRGVLAALEHQGLQENARVVGEHAIGLFRELQEKYEVVGDVRGRGLMIGMELVKDRETKETFTPEECNWLLRDYMSAEVFARGLICRADDRGEPVVQLAPPLIAGPEQFEEIRTVLRPVLEEASRRLGL